jgi:hypothetical protein
MQNIMNEKFRVVGMAWGLHTKYKYACVIDFAGGFGPKVGHLYIYRHTHIYII